MILDQLLFDLLRLKNDLAANHPYKRPINLQKSKKLQMAAKIANFRALHNEFTMRGDVKLGISSGSDLRERPATCTLLHE